MDGDGGFFARGAIEPPCSSTIFLTEARPRSMPVHFLVKNGLKTLSTIYVGIGAPGYRKGGLES